MRDPSTTHGTVITHFCVARRQGVNDTVLAVIKKHPSLVKCAKIAHMISINLLAPEFYI